VLGPATDVAVAVVVILATRWGAIAAARPAYRLTLLVAGAVSVVAITWSLVDVGRDRRVDGLLPWASYPRGNIASATPLLVTSVAAGNDGLATPATIEASRPDLSPGARFVTVEGAVHADFGDYGTQRGDGTPTISRADSQRQMEAASLDLPRRVDGRTGP
jgi:hypothetical protein